jgi:hypothetical protein
MSKMREQQMAINREAFASHSEEPADFSRFQLETYLKAAAFRRVSCFASVSVHVGVPLDGRV